VHVLSLAILVAIGGTYILKVLPPVVTDAFAFILPAVIGPVFVQLALTLKSPKVVIVGIGIAAIMVFGLVPLVPAMAPVALPIVVIATVGAAVAFSRRSRTEEVAA